jgi:hypothetical protein
MSLTTTDLTAIESAIATGELRVRFSDGREVQYRTIDELLKARALIKDTIAYPGGGGVVRSTFASFTKD